MEKEKISIGLFGYGNAGQDLYDVLNKSKELKTSIRKICIQNTNLTRITQGATGNNGTATNQESLVLVQSIDNASYAFEMVSSALQNKKTLVSASEKMIMEHGNELDQFRRQKDVALFYEGSCCASIPIIKNLEEHYDIDLSLCLILHDQGHLLS
jgi:homoserine dehydrogenase